MVDELLDTFQRLAVGGVRRDPGHRPHPTGEARGGGAGLVRRDRRQPQRGGDLPERRGLPAGFQRFAYLKERNIRFRNLWTGLLTEGVASGELRSDLDVELVYRFLRDTVWVAVRWYRPGGDLSPAQVADQYLHILLDGIAT